MTTLDTTGLICPLPVLRARKALKALAVGEVLEVRASDPASARDFPAFCEAAGHRLLEARREEGLFVFRIEKGALAPK
jgi:tRNA 2-thiouridine synthesizing protein A